MDEMYEWLKTRRKRRLRLLAALLGVGVLLTSLPRLPEAIEGALASGQPIRTVREFAPLSKDVREQTVPIGTTFRELDLPDTLEAYIFTENNEKNEGGGVNGDSEEEPDGPDPGENTGDGVTDGTGEGPADGIGDGVPDGSDGDNAGGDGTTDGFGGDTGDGVTDGSGDNVGDGATDGSGDNVGDGVTDGSGNGAGDGVTGGSGDSTGDDVTDGSGDSTGDSVTDGSGDSNGGAVDGAGDAIGGGSEGSGDAGDSDQGRPENGVTEDAGSSSSDEKEESHDSGAEPEAETSGDQARAVMHKVHLPEYRTESPGIRVETLYQDGSQAETDGGALAVDESSVAADSAEGAPAAADGEGESPVTEEEGADVTAGDGTGDAEGMPAAGAEDGNSSPEGEWMNIPGIDWECSPAYDSSTPDVYTFQAVLPETYVLAEGASLPVITVTVQEEEEAEADAVPYASISSEEVAPLVQEDERTCTITSADNAGDSHKVRVLWYTTSNVTPLASSADCGKSWVGVRVPGMSDRKYYLNKEMLRDRSNTYILGEFILPYSYEDREVIFPTEFGIYSSLSWAVSGVFEGKLTFQCANSITHLWETYASYTVSPDTDLTGDSLPDDRWIAIGQANWIGYVDLDMENMYLDAYLKEDTASQHTWPVVCMDRFGVPVTNAGKGWGIGWSLQKEDGGDYPGSYQLSIRGDMESFTLQSQGGTDLVEELPTVCAAFYAPGGTDTTVRFGIGRLGGTGGGKGKITISYRDYMGVVHRETAEKLAGVRIQNVEEIERSEGREIVCPPGRQFAGTYTGNDGKTYRPGDSVILQDSLVLYMDWEPRRMKFTLDARNDEWWEYQEELKDNEVFEIELEYDVRVEEKVPVPSAATHAPEGGYRFGGWIGPNEDGEEVQFFDQDGKAVGTWRPYKDMTLIALWERINTYHLLPGEDAWCARGSYRVWCYPQAKMSLRNLDIILPKTEEEIYRHGYEFVGWFDAETGGNEITEETQLPTTQDFYVWYARWKPVEVTLTLDANGGTLQGGGTTWNRNQKVSYGQRFSEVSGNLPTPVWPGKAFAGWAYRREALIRDTLKDSHALNQAEDFTLYAIWHQNNITVYLNPNGGSFANPSDASVKTDAGETVSLPVPTRQDYDFAGWKDQKGKIHSGGTFTVPADASSSLTLTAEWVGKTYQVRFDKNGGTGSMIGNPLSLRYGASGRLSKNYFTRSGYHFAGWNTQANGTGISYADEARITMGRSITLYAQWEPDVYLLSFEPAGGVLPAGTAPQKKVTYGTTYGALPQPTKEKYTFAGWYTAATGGTPVTSTTKIPAAGGGIVLYARWTYANFTLSFDLKGGTGTVDCAFGEMEGPRNPGITLPKAAPLRAGWTFEGFSREDDNTVGSTDFSAEKILGSTPPAVKPLGAEETVTLYAVWSSTNLVLTYDKNTTDLKVTVPNTVQFVDGKVTVSAAKLTRTGYTHEGWALSKDGKVQYTGGETIYSSVSMTLYAVWKADADEVEGVGSSVECKYRDAAGKWQMTTLLDAIDKVPENGEIILLKDLTMTTFVHIEKGNFTINLNGQALMWPREGYVMGLENCSVTFKNGSVLPTSPSMEKLYMTAYNGGTVTLDGVETRQINAMQGGHIILKGATRLKSAGTSSATVGLGITENSTAEIFYAEIDGTKGSAVSVTDSDLTIHDGYFWSLYGTAAAITINQNGTGNVNLNGGYYYINSSVSGRTIGAYNAADRTDGENRVCIRTVSTLTGGSGFDSGVKVSGSQVSPSYSGVSFAEWYTPSSGSGTTPPSGAYWHVYDEPGETKQGEISTAQIAAGNYQKGDTRFVLQREVAAVSGAFTADQTAKKAVIDLNNGRLSATGNVTLGNFTLRNGTLEKTGTSGTVSLKNGVIESDAQIRVEGGTAILDKDSLRIRPGAVFYVSGSAMSGFQEKYVNKSGKLGPDFGGTVLEEISNIDGTLVCRAVLLETTTTTFHPNYPADAAGTGTGQSKQQTIGKAWVIPATPSAPTGGGFTFGGWNTEPDGSGSVVAAGGIYQDATVGDVYAIWRRNNVTVTFKVNGGKWADAAFLGVTGETADVRRMVSYGGTMENGALPTVLKEGYVFSGWYTTADSGGEKLLETTVIKSNKTFYARWQAAEGTKYTVTWQGEKLDGTTVRLDRLEVYGRTDVEVEIAGLARPFAGYTFSQKDSVVKHSGNLGGTKNLTSFLVRADGSVEVTLVYLLNTPNVQVKAQRQDYAGNTLKTSNFPNVKVQLSDEGKIGSSTSITTDTAGTAQNAYKYGSNVTLEAGPMPGYTFAGWTGDYTASGESLGFRMPDQAVNVTVVYTRNTYDAEKTLSHIHVAAGGEKVTAGGFTAGLQPEIGVPHDGTYIVAIEADEGYTLPQTVTLQRGTGSPVSLENGKTVNSAKYVLGSDGRTATVTVNNVTTDLVVAGEGVPKTYRAEFVHHDFITADPAEKEVKHGEPFIMTLRAESGYVLADTVTVMMGGKLLRAEDNDYLYHPEDGSLYLPGVTGDVTVSADAQPGLSSYQVAYYRQALDGTYSDTPYQTTDYYTTEAGDAVKTGDTVNLLAGGSLVPAYGRNYKGFVFDEGKKEHLQGTVTADGSLTLQVYYKRQEYQVSIRGGFWAEGGDDPKPFYYGAPVTLTVLEQTGYDTVWSGFGSGGSDGKISFTMPAEDVELVVDYRPKALSVLEGGLTNVRFQEGTEETAYYRTTYKAVIEADKGYTLPQTVNVRVAGQELASDQFTYDPASGEITILADAVTGSIGIVAKGVVQQWNVEVQFEDNTTPKGKTILSASPESGTVETGGSLFIRLDVHDLYYVLPDLEENPEKLTVYMGAKELTEGDGFTYDRGVGYIRITEITEDVVVRMSPVEAPPSADYQIEHYKENLDGTFTLAQTVHKRSAVIGSTVDVNGADAKLLKSYRGFTFDGSADGTVASVQIQEDGSSVLKLYYRRNSCTLTLTAEAGITAYAENRGADVSGTVMPDTQEQLTFKYGESVTVSVSQVADGSSFAGWYQAGQVENLGTSHNIFMTEDQALTAKSRLTTYELIVEGTHGSSSLPGNYEEQIIFGTDRTLELTPDTGYHLPDALTMLVDGEEAAAGSHTYTKETDGSGKVELTVTGDTHLLFDAEPNRYQMVFHANGGRIKTEENTQGVERTVMEAVYDAAYGSLPVAEREDYIFLGWFAGPEDGEEITARTVHRTDGDRVAYAHWEKEIEEDPGEDPGKDPGENPGDKPGENPGDKPGENPGDKPGENPGDKPGENTGDKPGENPGDKPGENPGDKPGENPGDKPGENPGDKPGENPGDKPGEDPGDKPGENPGDHPGENPGDNPGEKPGNKPGSNSGNRPGDSGDKKEPDDTDSRNPDPGLPPGGDYAAADKPDMVPASPQAQPGIVTKVLPNIPETVPEGTPALEDPSEDTLEDTTKGGWEDTTDNGGKKGQKLPEGDGTVIVPSTMKNSRITPKDGKIRQAGWQDIHTVVLTVMDGAVIVHVNNVEETYVKAAATDAAAAANAVLTGEDFRRLTEGDFIEIRIDVTPYDDQVSERDRQLVQKWAAETDMERTGEKRTADETGEQTGETQTADETGERTGETQTADGIGEQSETTAGLTVGMYVDISVYKRAGEEEWQPVYTTVKPMEMILETPERLLELSADQTFHILRVHDQECTMLDDTDDVPETITFMSGLFSVYAVVYQAKEGAVTGGETGEGHTVSGCRLCQICPTFLGICCFVWLAVIMVVIILVVLILYLGERERRREQVKPR